MGASTSAPPVSVEQRGCPKKSEVGGGDSASCPKAAAAECPCENKENAASSSAAAEQWASECPMSGAGSPLLQIQKTDDIDPSNMMPPPNQRPAPDQPFPLPTERQQSTIPRSGKEENWVYPSEQMFWNAMLRKGWRWQEGDISKADMHNIIKIHNANNEQAWQEVLKWEAMHFRDCSKPQLKSFGGKYTDLSPRAKIRMWMGNDSKTFDAKFHRAVHQTEGNARLLPEQPAFTAMGAINKLRYERPFDRHDWIVDRCGRDVRYVIDYYDSGVVDSEFKFALLDVRPALDSPTALWDRMKATYRRWMFSSGDE